MTWTTIEEFPSYEISDQYDDSIHSYPIRRKKNEKLVGVSVDTKGYGRVYLDGKYRKVHRVIAKQFIENEDSEHKNDIDHIDANPLNNHIVNLRWCSRRDNERNRKVYNGKVFDHVDTVPQDAFQIERYRGYEFDKVFYHDEIFYAWNGVRYRKIETYQHHNKSCFWLQDSQGGKHEFSLNAFKREYNLG